MVRQTGFTGQDTTQELGFTPRSGQTREHQKPKDKTVFLVVSAPLGRALCLQITKPGSYCLIWFQSTLNPLFTPCCGSCQCHYLRNLFWILYLGTNSYGQDSLSSLLCCSSHPHSTSMHHFMTPCHSVISRFGGAQKTLPQFAHMRPV